jgi:hypothetical protein
MNKNHSFLMMVIAFFVLEARADSYDQIVLAYRKGTLNLFDKQEAIRVVQTHKQQLEAQQGTIGVKIGSVLTKLMGVGVFLASLASAGASAAIGYVAHNILSLPHNRIITDWGSGPGASYWELLKYGSGFDKSLITSAKVAYTENIFSPGLQEIDKNAITLGKIAPPLLGGSIIGLFAAGYLWNRPNQLKDKIVFDQAILDALNLQN